MSRVMISAAAYLLSFLFQPSLLWVLLPGATLWSKKRGEKTQVNSWFKEPPPPPPPLQPPQPPRYSSVAAAAKIVQNGNRIQRCQGHRI